MTEFLVPPTAPPHPFLRPPRSLILAFATGGISALSFAPVHAVLVLWISFPAFAFLLHKSSPGGAFTVGWAFGFGHFATGLYWIGASFGPAGQGGWWAGVPAVAGIAAGLALFPAIAALASRLAPQGFPRLLALAVAWPLAEALRSHLLWGFPWNLLGLAWAFSEETLQPVAWIGVHGLGALTALAALAPAALALRGKAAGALFLLPLGIVLTLGFSRDRTDPVTTDAAIIRIVQGNIPQEVKVDPARFSEGVITYMQASSRRADGKSPTLVIWPETALPLDPTSDPVLRRKLLDSIPADAWLATGAFRIETAAQGGRIYNSFYFLDPAGNVAEVYDKVHLVPFGEFLPLAEHAPGLARPFGGRGLSPGRDSSPIEIPGFPPFLPLICYEVIFSADTNGRRRPGWILNISNDGWFGRTSGPYQHLAHARARAVEEGVPVIRATNTGISAVINPHGRLLARLGLEEHGVIDALLPTAIPAPLHARTGDGPLFALLALILVGLLAPGLRRRARHPD